MAMERPSEASPRFSPPRSRAPTGSRRSTSPPPTPPPWPRTAFFPEDHADGIERKKTSQRPRVRPRGGDRRRPAPQESAPQAPDDARKGLPPDDRLAAARRLPRRLVPGAGGG